MTHADRICLGHTGEYSLTASVSLAASAAFVGSITEATATLDLVVLLEGSWSPVAVSIGQTVAGVRADIFGNPDGVPDTDIRTQLERMLCLDVDGAGFRAVAARDAVVAQLDARRPGVRPVLFPSPYEAAARAIIGHRLQVRQAAVVHERIATDYGVAMSVGGSTSYAFPAPARLAVLSPVSGLSERKVAQLRALAVAAGEGFLDRDRLRGMTRDAAIAHLQQLAGIGPFSADLILIRGAGDPDAFPVSELRLHRAMTQAYDLGSDPDLPTLERIAERWRPYRSWVALLLRNRTG